MGPLPILEEGVISLEHSLSARYDIGITPSNHLVKLGVAFLGYPFPTLDSELCSIWSARQLVSRVSTRTSFRR